MKSLIKKIIFYLYRIQLGDTTRPHPKYGAFDGAALLTAAELFARSSRRNYANGALLGALQAKKAGYDSVRMIEFGVASGDGLLALCEIAAVIARRLDLRIDIIGLDNGSGLFRPKDYRDHPEIWAAGQFSMGDQDALRRRLPPNCRLIIGDIAETVTQLDGDTPIAFVSIDVDFYSSTVPILDWLGRADVRNLLPATPVFFDDTFLNWTYAHNCGEELAIAEFNARSLPRSLTLKIPASRLFALHAFDHPMRTAAQAPREPLEINFQRYIFRPETIIPGFPS